MLLLPLFPFPASTQDQEQVTDPVSTLVIINQISQDQSAALSRLAPLIGQSMQSMTSPDTAAVVAREIMPTVTELRLALGQTENKLAAIDVEPGAMIGGVSLAAIVTDLQTNNAASMALLRDLSALFDAVSRRDAGAAGEIAQRVAQSAVLMIRNQILVVEVRRASTSISDSTHQALGLMTILYRGMEFAGERALRMPSSTTRSFDRLSADARVLVAAGRSNLSRELAELDALEASERRDVMTRATELEAESLNSVSSLQNGSRRLRRL